jgi:thiamine pyrophosphokinase
MKRGIIFLAGEFLSLPEDFRISPNDVIIAADGGYEHTTRLGIHPNLLIGDFDSLSEAKHNQAILQGIATKTWPKDKDQTDGEIAIRAAADLGCTHLILFGAWGGDRLDHSIGNLTLLETCYQLGIEAMIHHKGENIIFCIPGSYILSGMARNMVSLIPISPEVTKVCVSGLRYALLNETLIQGTTRGMSNEFTESKAIVTFEAGKLWLIWQGKPTDLLGYMNDVCH